MRDAIAPDQQVQPLTATSTSPVLAGSSNTSRPAAAPRSRLHLPDEVAWETTRLPYPPTTCADYVLDFAMHSSGIFNLYLCTGSEYRQGGRADPAKSPTAVVGGLLSIKLPYLAEMAESLAPTTAIGDTIHRALEGVIDAATDLFNECEAVSIDAILPQGSRRTVRGPWTALRETLERRSKQLFAVLKALETHSKNVSVAAPQDRAMKKPVSQWNDLDHVANNLEWMRGKLQSLAVIRRDTPIDEPFEVDGEKVSGEDWWAGKRGVILAKLWVTKQRADGIARLMGLPPERSAEIEHRVRVLVDRAIDEWLGMLKPGPWTKKELKEYSALRDEVEACAREVRNTPGKAPAPPKWSLQEPKAQSGPLDSLKKRVRIKKKWYPLTDRQFKIVQDLYDAEGQWMTGVLMHCATAYKFIARMPRPVQRIIETRTGHGGGYRIAPDRLR